MQASFLDGPAFHCLHSSQLVSTLAACDHFTAPAVRLRTKQAACSDESETLLAKIAVPLQQTSGIILSLLFSITACIQPEWYSRSLELGIGVFCIPGEGPSHQLSLSVRMPRSSSDHIAGSLCGGDSTVCACRRRQVYSMSEADYNGPSNTVVISLNIAVVPPERNCSRLFVADPSTMSSTKLGLHSIACFRTL